MTECCGECANWDPHGPRDMEGVNTGDCETLREALRFTYYHPLYAGGSTVESVETERGFACSLYTLYERRQK